MTSDFAKDAFVGQSVSKDGDPESGVREVTPSQSEHPIPSSMRCLTLQGHPLNDHGVPQQVVVTVHSLSSDALLEEDWAEPTQVIPGLRSFAQSGVTKSRTPAELAQAVRVAVEGERRGVPFDPTVLNEQLERIRNELVRSASSARGNLPGVDGQRSSLVESEGEGSGSERSSAPRPRLVSRRAAIAAVVLGFLGGMSWELFSARARSDEPSPSPAASPFQDAIPGNAPVPPAR